MLKDKQLWAKILLYLSMYAIIRMTRAFLKKIIETVKGVI